MLLELGDCSQSQENEENGDQDSGDRNRFLTRSNKRISETSRRELSRVQLVDVVAPAEGCFGWRHDCPLELLLISVRPSQHDAEVQLARESP